MVLCCSPESLEKQVRFRTATINAQQKENTNLSPNRAHHRLLTTKIPQPTPAPKHRNLIQPPTAQPDPSVSPMTTDPSSAKVWLALLI